MYLGKVVEHGNAENVFLHPKHDYTKTLLTAIPQPDPYGREERKKQRLDSKKYSM